MKILTSEQIRQADAFTIKNEPVSSLDLMERAATSCLDWILENLESNGSVFHIFCGSGNNGGDGLALARLLFKKGISVTVYIIRFKPEGSADFEKNLKRLRKAGINITELKNDRFNINFGTKDVAVDAIFGTGLKKPVSGLIKKIIQKINSFPVLIISIDIPSGLFSEFNEKNDLDAVVKADFTLTFQNPKLAMVLEGSGLYCGEWEVLDIGLDLNFINSLPSDYFILSEEEIWAQLKEREKFQHKGDFGHALIAAGSKGKVGAAVLASRACLRSGVGLLTALVPECAYQIMQTSVPEVMCLTSGNNELSGVPGLTEFSVVGMGPGIGLSSKTSSFLKKVLQVRKDPMVLDADVLNILSGDKKLLKLLPEKSILTPHPGEFRRLAGEWKDDADRLKKQIEFSAAYKVIVVLKGGHTSISTPDGLVYFNTTGNPGMATAGSGDVLLGMITGLLARGYEPLDAACVGVYLHGLAGDIAASKFGMESMKSGDIVDSIPDAFLYLY